jgi:hypothetical protein
MLFEMMYGYPGLEKQQEGVEKNQGRFYNSSLTVTGKIEATPPAI